MYTAEDRSNLLAGITASLKNEPEFEGLLLMGSGAEGFTDLYSDIDMMAGCFSADVLSHAGQKLQFYFRQAGACLIHHRFWTETVLGLSVYYENGLSVDISFMPTEELPIRSSPVQILFSKTNRFRAAASEPAAITAAVTDPYALFLELRYTAIALCRGNLILADIAMNRARQIILNLQTARESKKLHQFKAYHSLSRDFLDALEETYPTARTVEAYRSAMEKIISLSTTQRSDAITEEMWYMIKCFR